MVETLKHKNYTIVQDEKEADAFAWVFTDPKKPMQKVAFKFPAIAANEVRIKVTYAGLCHSDIHTVRQDWGPVEYPIAPGHEIVGRVIAVGKDVKDFKIGDKAGFGCQRESCGKCEVCKQDLEQLCTDPSVKHRFTYDDMYWGGYATALQQPADFYFKIPDNLPEEKIPPLFCAGVTVYAPIARYAKPGQEVAVLGIGGLGHMAVQYLKAWGCKTTAFTSSPGKEEFIKKLGADRVVIGTPENLQKEAGKFHLILNTLPISEDYVTYVNLTRKLGTFVNLGVPAVEKPASFMVHPLIFNHINVTGSLIGSRKEIREMLAFSSKHNIVPLVEEFDFEDFPKAFDKLEHGKPIFRCVVNATKTK